MFYLLAIFLPLIYTSSLLLLLMKNLKHINKHSHWIEAMNSELEAIHHNKTWTITDLPQGKKPISCKWVYKIKHKVDGSIRDIKLGW